MKKINFAKALLLMAAMGLGACSDNLTNDAGSVVQGPGEGEGCVTFKINTIGNETRATRVAEGETLDDSFDNGEEFEYLITTTKGANAVFFFKDNIYIGKKDLQVSKSTPDNTGTENHDPEYDQWENASELYLSAYIKKADIDKQLKFAVILNADPDLLNKLNLQEDVTTFDEFIKMEQVYTDNADGLLGVYKNGKGNFFTMSNTVYVDENNQLPNGIVNYTTIGPENVYPTPEEARANPVVVHVERVVAKFSLSYGTKDTNIANELPELIEVTKKDPNNTLSVRKSATEAATSSSWKIKVLGWDINGIEKKTFWTKNLMSGSQTVYDASTGVIDGHWDFRYDWATTAKDKGWNDLTRLRSYWAVDPDYEGTGEEYYKQYPYQYREVANDNNAEFTCYNDQAVLRYFSFNEIRKNLGGHHYAPENTFGKYDFIKPNPDAANDGYAYKGNDYKRAATHVLIAAQLVLDGEEAESPAGKYCYEGAYWLPDSKAELIKYMAEQLRFAYSPTLYKENGDEFYPLELSADEVETYFTLDEPATVKDGDGRVMLKLQKDEEGKGMLYTKTDDGFVAVDPDEEELMAAIYTVGTAKHFKAGMMYYAIPIEHMVTYKKDVDNSQDNKYNIGSFGVVRNHWYRVNIKKIANPGIPVDDPDQPIIPNDEPDEGGYISFEIVILPWHVINWGVDL